MKSLTTLYDGYIDRPKLSEQKKPFEYIVPLPLKWVGTIMELIEFMNWIIPSEKKTFKFSKIVIKNVDEFLLSLSYFCCIHIKPPE